MSSEIILDTKLVDEIKGEYYVPSYQRGYRWGKDEVIRLLDDVYQNGKENYCLQPIVVRKKGDVFELVDGQQRLTTLYLIYKYMKNVNPLLVANKEVGRNNGTGRRAGNVCMSTGDRLKRSRPPVSLCPAVSMAPQGTNNKKAWIFWAAGTL